MSKSRMVGGLVLLVAVSVAVAKERVYKTPQEVFAAAKEAAKKKDWKTMCGTLTKESRDGLAGMVILPMMMAKKFIKLAPEEKQKEILAELKPINDALAKHGLTEEVLAKMDQGKPPVPGPETFKKLLAPVKDRCALVADMLNALEKMSAKKGKKGSIFHLRDAELKDVKIEGNKARGTVITKTAEAEKNNPIEFRKIDGSWKIVFALQVSKGPKTGPPRGK